MNPYFSSLHNLITLPRQGHCNEGDENSEYSICVFLTLSVCIYFRSNISKTACSNHGHFVYINQLVSPLLTIMGIFTAGCYASAVLAM